MRWVFILLLFFCFCKKKQNPEPEINITSPPSGAEYSPGDTVYVEADLRDDEPLESVSLRLLNESYTPVDHLESFPVNAASFHLSFPYVIENSYLSTGNYYITLSTTDGDNDVNEFRTIRVNEIPKTRKSVYLLTRSDSLSFSVNKIDSSGSFIHQFIVTGDYGNSLINSRYAQLVTSGKKTGSFNQFDLNSNSVSFTIPPYNGVLPSFQSLAAYNNYSFISFFDGNIKAFDKDGNLKFQSDQPVSYIPGAICATDQYIFAEAWYQIANENRLVVLFYPSGAAMQEYNISIDLVSMIPINENELLVFGNSNGMGKILVYHVMSNSTGELHNLNSEFYCAIAVDNDLFAIAAEGGLYSYRMSMNSLVPVDPAEAVYSLAYDDVNGILFASSGKKLKEYAFPSGPPINNTTTTDSIIDVRILFSK